MSTDFNFPGQCSVLFCPHPACQRDAAPKLGNTGYCNLHCTAAHSTMNSILHTAYCTLQAHCTLNILRFTLLTKICKVNTIHYILNTTKLTLHTIFSRFDIPYQTQQNIQCAFYTVHFALHTKNYVPKNTPCKIHN